MTSVSSTTAITASSPTSSAIPPAGHRPGGVIAYRDTDSSIIPASLKGGWVQFDDGSFARELAWSDVYEILSAFAPLSPGADWPVWKVERGTDGDPLRALVFGPKGHLERVGDEVVKRTETALGGFFCDPASTVGRDDDGHRSWTRDAACREVAFAEQRAQDPSALRSAEVPWDEPNGLAFPALRRLRVSTPEVAHSLPASLGVRPGSRFVEGTVAELRRGVGPSPVALDPGGDLSDWRELHWVERATGQPLRVTTDPNESRAVLLDTLDA